MTISIQVKINPSLYLRDPQETKLGRQIIQNGVLLLDRIGLEEFTFRKLADEIGSTEASVYRYFGNKHKLLVYLLCWYWEWLRFRIEFNTTNIDSPLEKLRISIDTIVRSKQQKAQVDFIDIEALHRIVISESTKAYHIKNVDIENKQGFFLTYKTLSKQIASIIREVNPDFPYPHALASNLLEMSNNHIFFAEHLPSLTDIEVKGGELGQVVEMLSFFAITLLQKK